MTVHTSTSGMNPRVRPLPSILSTFMMIVSEPQLLGSNSR